VREARTSDGLYSANDPRLFFGLGEVDSVDRIEVRWPNGERTALESPAPDTLHTLRETRQETR
jgi:hypothetical protein